MTPDELLSALKNAEGPSRELDAEIDALWRIGPLDKSQKWLWDNFPTWAARKNGRCMAGGIWWLSAEYTSSIDAALTLIEPEVEFEISTLHCIARVSVGLNLSDTGPFCGERADGNIPIAICIAALKARMGI